MSEERLKVSLVIPAYNEEARIGAALEKAQTYFSEQDYDSEIVVVDDGSTDTTAAIVRENFPDVLLLRYEENRGKGYAMRHGIANATGDYRVVYDADASTPIAEVEKIWAEFEQGAALVLGSRALPGSNVQVRQPRYRRLMGRSYNVLLRTLRLTTFRDTQCGFKGFTAECCEIVFPKLTVNGFGSDCEMLFVAERHGLRVVEVPVHWINSLESRVNPILDSLYMFGEVLRIRLNAMLGRYH